MKFKNYLLLSFVLLAFSCKQDDLTTSTLTTAGANPTYIRYDNEDKGSLTPGNLSVGKFYRYSRQPDPAYSDIYPCDWSDGSRLTDEAIATSGNTLVADNYVGWSGNEKVDITFDIGRPHLLRNLNINGLVNDAANALLPTRVDVYIKEGANSRWLLFGSNKDLSGLQQTKASYLYHIVVSGKETKGRYIKLIVTPNAAAAESSKLLLDEVNLMGRIKNTWRYVPEKGILHGAFPTAVGFSPEQLGTRTGMVVDIFEKEVGKKLSMVLWYQAMTEGRNFQEIQNYRNNQLKVGYDGNRFLSIGWLPTELLPLAEGGYDAFFTKYFTDAVNPDILNGIKDPIWLRPMNEFNGGWVAYGLKPDLYRKAWRRMYNIAEQTGAAAQHIFVWSPNYLSFPNEEWNKMQKYYPGDQYVDWVGLSCYPPSLGASSSEAIRYPIENIAEAYNLYAHYKPFMISEGGYSESVDPVRWVKEWFDFKTMRPNVKAVIWENHNDRAISLHPEALELYRSLIKDDYWLGENLRKPGSVK
jgi:hypothetical protein